MTHRIWILIAACLFLAACGGGGGGSGGGSTGTAPVPIPGPTEAEAGRLLAQGTFGATEASIEAVRAGTVESWIRAQINTPPPSVSHQAYLDARLAGLRVTSPNANLSYDHFVESWWLASVTGQDQLRERVAFAYSQIFVISLASDVVDPRGAGAYYDMLTANAFGNYRDLLEKVTLNPMMGRYLTYLGNTKEDAAGTRTPDENYAREVMQLMTLGLYQLNLDGTPKTDISGRPLAAYTPADISGLAKVFTGWSWYSPAPSASTFFGRNPDPDSMVRQMIFYPQYHSTSQKAFLGTAIPASTTVDGPGDLKIALDTLFNHPNTGPFISRQLIQRLVTSNPSPAYVQRVAGVFNNNGAGVRGDMGAVVTAILMDPEARNATTAEDPAYGKLREPVIRMTHMMRAFQGNSVSGKWQVRSTGANTSLGQSPLLASSVFNFWRPGYVPPGTTTLGSRNLAAPEFQIVNEVTNAGYVNVIEQTISNGIGTGNDVRLSLSNEVLIADKPEQLADRLNRLLMAGQMSSALRKRVLDTINAYAISTTDLTQANQAKTNRVKAAVLLVMTSPEYLVQR
ncbi:DUF1800 family protein [Phenylobacterium sp.]|jgi:uncharacterized protein (DUF1800 family)|uniref:DUF1800 family protein n=1 Tax=Phenylobacterium sp. TaxID=1871053 RepID=UPI0037CA9D3C